mmetsp:Transcript_7909/g.48876  ORF Transcript_7909/g.48876 Transcript_7909/m.48876 type:complete len:115 (-) Transcript_7909:980-1324(-)
MQLLCKFETNKTAPPFLKKKATGISQPSDKYHHTFHSPITRCLLYTITVLSPLCKKYRTHWILHKLLDRYQRIIQTLMKHCMHKWEQLRTVQQELFTLQSLLHPRPSSRHWIEG